MTFRVAFLLACLFATPAFAQKPTDFAPFWSEFSAAAKTGDKAKVRALTKFPFLHKSDMHEEKAFDTIWKDLFTAGTRACLGKASRSGTRSATIMCCSVAKLASTSRRPTPVGFQRNWSERLIFPGS